MNDSTINDLWGVKLISVSEGKEIWGAWVLDLREAGFETKSEAQYWVLLELAEQLNHARKILRRTAIELEAYRALAEKLHA